MVHTGLAGIYLLVADLTLSRDHHLTSLSGPGTSLAPSDIPPIAAFQHWALLIRSQCYEVTSHTYHPTPLRHEYEMRVSHILVWEDRRQRHGLKFESLKVGATLLSDQEISNEGNANPLNPIPSWILLTRDQRNSFGSRASRLPTSSAPRIARTSHIACTPGSRSKAAIRRYPRSRNPLGCLFQLVSQTRHPSRRGPPPSVSWRGWGVLTR